MAIGKSGGAFATINRSQNYLGGAMQTAQDNAFRFRQEKEAKDEKEKAEIAKKEAEIGTGLGKISSDTTRYSTQNALIIDASHRLRNAVAEKANLYKQGKMSKLDYDTFYANAKSQIDTIDQTAKRINAQSTTSVVSLLAGNTGLLVITPTSTVSSPFFDLQTRTRSTLTSGTTISVFNVSRSTQTWATGNVPVQYFNTFQSQIMGFAGGSTVGLVANAMIAHPTAGANSAFNTATALYISGGTYTNTTTAYGILIDSISGATTNYGLGVIGNVSITGNTTTNSLLVNNRSYYNLTPATGSTAITIDWSTSNMFDYTLTTATTLTGADKTYIIRK